MGLLDSRGPEVLSKDWKPSLRDGLAFAGGPDAPPQGGFSCASCGQLFSQPGSLRAAGNEHFDSSDITELDAELVLALLDEARLAEPGRA